MSESKHLKRIPRTFQELVDFSSDRFSGKAFRLTRELIKRYIKQVSVQITDEINSDSLQELYHLSVQSHFTKVTPSSVLPSVLTELSKPDKFGDTKMKTVGTIDTKSGIGVQYAKFIGEDSIYCLPLNESDPVFKVNLYLSDVSAFFMGDEFDEASFIHSSSITEDKEGMTWVEEAPSHIRKAGQN